MSVDDACRELDSKKRWLENYLNDKKPNEAERYVTQFTDALKQKEEGVLKGTPQLTTYKSYLEDAKKRFEALKISDEADELLRKWNDGLYVVIVVVIVIVFFFPYVFKLLNSSGHVR